MNSEQVIALLRRAEQVPEGPAQIAAAEEAIRHADALGEEPLRFAARMLATEAYERGGEPAGAFVTFSWALADFDRAPGYHDRADDWRLRWHFKYVCGSLSAFPEVPLDRTAAVLDDMERRYRAGGHSLHAVYTQRFALARHLGDDDAAAHWYAQWQAAPRDENSDCAGCDPTSRAHYLYDLGRSAEAVALAEPVLAGRLTCTVQPHAILTALMLPLLRTGAPARARDAHLRAYRRQRTNVARLWSVAAHARFCLFTGNDARALEIVRRHLEWLDRAPSPYDAMEFAATASAVLRRTPGASVRRAAAGERAAADRDAAELAELLAGEARAVGARFDARNGNGYQSERVEMLLHAGPLGEYVPLSPTVAARSAASGASAGAGSGDPAGFGGGSGEGAAASGDGTGPAGGRSGGPAGPGVDVAAESGMDGAAGFGVDGVPGVGAPGSAAGREPAADAAPADVLDEVELRQRSGAVSAARALLAERGGELDAAPLTTAQRARLAEARGWVLLADDDHAGARAHWAVAEAGYREAGDEVGARMCAGARGLAACFAARTAEDADAATTAPILPAPTAAAPGPAADEPAPPADGPGTTPAGTVDVPGTTADAPSAGEASGTAAEPAAPVAAGGAVGGEEYAEGLAAVRESAAYVEAHGGPAEACRARIRLAVALATGGDPAGALAALDAAEPLAARAGDRRLDAALALRRMQVLAELGREDALPDALARAYTAGRGLGGDDRGPLCLAYAESLPDDAVPEKLAVLAEALAADGSPDVVINAHLYRGRLLRGADRPAEAVDDYVAALGACLAAGAAEPAAFLRAELAETCLTADRVAEAAELAEEALPGLVAAGADEGADQCRYLLARCYRELGEVPAAVAVLDELADRIAGADRGRMREEAATLLYGVDRDAEAATRYADAAAAYAAADRPMDRLRALRQRVSALHWARDADAALAALTEADAALEALPADAAAHPEGVWERALLDREGARALAAADRPDAALDRLDDAAARLRGIEAFGEALTVDILHGELLLRLGRPDAAEPVLRAALGGIPRDAGALAGRTAALLAGCLVELGRRADAEALAAEYGLD
ncbi:hypothetical protein GCM10010123_00750 [Pilimelia anulata]|uniref:Tetratricopeptide repeat protein n=1 Tax=Pilimelia anulata TaxID=53371 RepID=A0A8J3B117_9ACTN|nr:hypothetical protein [Pilimelia anulata]GGJ74614.1 hypothetical protein GCM10010123_00750 [Pilimelia anulata]